MATSQQSFTPEQNFSWLNPAYQTAIEKYHIKGLGTELEGEYEFPGLVLENSSQEFDLEENIIFVSPGKVSANNFDELTETLDERLSEIHSVRQNSEALTQRSREAIDWLENIYDTKIEFNGAYFRDLPGNTLGKSRRKEREFRIDRSYMEQFNPEKNRFEHDNPVNTLEKQVERLNTLLEEGRENLEPKVSKVASTPLHEARHWLSYELDQRNLEYKKNRPQIEKITGENRSWGEDITVAPLEAETTFDQFIYGYNGKKRRKKPLEAFHKPLENPEFFRNYNELTAQPERTEITSPYNLGLFLTLASYHRSRQDMEDIQALQNAREYATDLRMDPEGLEQEVNEYLEWRIGDTGKLEL